MRKSGSQANLLTWPFSPSRLRFRPLRERFGRRGPLRNFPLKIARNPLISLDSDERIQGNPRKSNPHNRRFSAPKQPRPRQSKLAYRPAYRGPIPARITRRRKGPTAESAAKPAPRAKSTGAKCVSNDRLRVSTAPVRSMTSIRLGFLGASPFGCENHGL